MVRRGGEKIPAGWGSFFLYKGKIPGGKIPGSLREPRGRSNSGPDTFADRRLSTFTGGWVTIFYSYVPIPNPSAGAGLIVLLFPKVIELSGDTLAELVRPPV